MTTKVHAETFDDSVSGGMEALGTLAGIRFDLLFRDRDAIIQAFEEGSARALEMFGPDVSFGGPRWAGISYGHINSLGSELVFPEDSEVAHTPVYGSLAEGVRALQRRLDFTRQGLFPFYLDLWEQLKAAFPTRAINFAGFGCEGPLTTAWLLRGHDFFMDIHDDPQLAMKYLQLVTQSVIAYTQTLARINGQPPVAAWGSFLADDGAAMIAPRQWPALVMPHLETYFRETTTGARHAHIEGLTPAHLHYLDQLRLDNFDPSVSPKLSPQLIRAHCQIHFEWRLNEGDLATLNEEQTRRWVTDAAAQGAPAVRTGVWRNNCTTQSARNIRAFVETAARVRQELARGTPRSQLSLRRLGRAARRTVVPDKTAAAPTPSPGTADE